MFDEDDFFISFILVTLVVGIVGIGIYCTTEYQTTPGGRSSFSDDRNRLAEWNNFAKLHKLQPITIDQAVLLEDRDIARMELAVLARESEASIVNATDWVNHGKVGKRDE